MTEKTCFGCGSKFAPSRSDQLFCSKSCKIKYNRKPYFSVSADFNTISEINGGAIKGISLSKTDYWKKRLEKFWTRLYNTNNEKLDGFTPIYIWSKEQHTVRFYNQFQRNAP